MIYKIHTKTNQKWFDELTDIIPCNKNIVINDTTDPIPLCQDITIQLDDTTGTATITAAQIDNGSTDNCGIVNLGLSQSTFDCTNIGPNTVILTVTDVHGNESTCNAAVSGLGQHSGLNVYSNPILLQNIS